MTDARPVVAGIDPGTISFDVCGLRRGEVYLDVSFPSGELATDPSPLVDALLHAGPFDIVLGPAGYGLPLAPLQKVTPHDISLVVLVRADEARASVGIGGLRAIIRALLDADLPLLLGPGVIHLPTVPAHRKWNRVDMGTADKVATAAACIVDQARRLKITYHETSFVMLDVGGAFSAALAVHQGQIVDGLGGSSGPIGVRASGALDAETAYLIGPHLSKTTVFSGGALDPHGRLDIASVLGPGPRARDPGLESGWKALAEGAAKAALSLTAVVPLPREVLLTGRMVQAPRLVSCLVDLLSHVAPVHVAQPLRSRAKTAAQGAALLADGLAGGRFAPLVAQMRLAEARGSSLDHLRVTGSEHIHLA